MKCYFFSDAIIKLISILLIEEIVSLQGPSNLIEGVKYDHKFKIV